MRYHLTLIRMAIIKKSTNNKCSVWRKENALTLLLGMYIDTVTVKDRMETA